jgi:DNA-directed RNA polymerase specialized sigma24 family protein
VHSTAVDDLADAIALLPDLERMIIRLRWLEEFTVADIAGCLCITEQEVLDHDASARAALRRRLDPVDFETLLPCPLEHLG